MLTILKLGICILFPIMFSVDLKSYAIGGIVVFTMSALDIALKHSEESRY